MNLFAFWKNKDGEDELITPPLDGTVLPGITRMSILQMMSELGEFKVSEKPFKIQELMEAADEDRLYEVFGSGTAVLVSPINEIQYKDKTIKVPINEEKGIGPLAERTLQMLNDYQCAKAKKPEW